jgi:hypothetical protein
MSLSTTRDGTILVSGSYAKSMKLWELAEPGQ